MSARLEPTHEGDFTFAGNEPFRLAAGGQLQSITLRYALYGALNKKRDNAIFVCHALSGSARVGDWWPEMFGHGGAFDISRYCIIGANVLGSCYGSTGPLSLDARTGAPYGANFPLITISDIVRAQARLLDHLDIKRLHAVVGGSIGGMQALEWAVAFPEQVERCVAIGACALPAMGLALNHLQRQAIRNDPAWRDGHYAPDAPPEKGLALARAIAMCSYKSAELFNERFNRHPNRTNEDPHRTLDERFDVAGYLDNQGATFTRRFDANSYLLLSKAMDTFDLARGYCSEQAALQRITARVLLVGLSSDWLFPTSEVRALAARMKSEGVDVAYAELHTAHGHDGFLAEARALAPLVAPLLID